MEFATLPDGAKLAYDEYNFVEPWISPEPVILVHGFSKNRKFWFEWLPQLTRKYRVICPDQRGHGDSSLPPDGFQMALEPFADDLAHFLDCLGLKSAHFVMAEFSSTVAVEFAIKYPERIRSLTLPGFAYNYRASKVDRSEWVRICETEGAMAWARATNGNRLPAGTSPEMREWYIAQQGRMPAWFLAALFRFNPDIDLTQRLGLIKVPTLIIAGSQAQQGSIETVRLASKLIPDCRLVELEGMPYNVMSAAPGPCIAATLAFLGERTTAL
jgi:3-oxoadipate enol-lactonase